MSVLAIDDNLLVGRLVKLLLDALLQAKHHRASRIDDFDVVLSGQLVGGRWLSVCPEQYLHVMQLGELFVVDGDEAHLLQAFTFLSVVHNVSQAIEGIPLC